MRGLLVAAEVQQRITVACNGLPGVGAVLEKAFQLGQVLNNDAGADISAPHSG